MRLLTKTLRVRCLFVCALGAWKSDSFAAPINTDIIGTWRWISVDGRRVDRQPFYMRFYTDGKSVSWPAPKGWADAKGVSRGSYAITKGFLVLKTGAGRDDPKTRIRIENDEMKLTTDEGHELVYHRILPSIEPGKMEDGKPVGYLKDPR